MRVSRVIETLNKRREYLLEKLQQLPASAPIRSYMDQEQRAIECAIPILQVELDRRQRKVMDDRIEAQPSEVRA